MIEAVRDLIEWLANDSATLAAGLFPWALLGLCGLYVLWLLIGYLRVSQLTVAEQTVAQPALRLPRAPDGVFDAPRGVPHCPVDGLQYPPGARFCVECESDLLVSCANCGATIRAADESCYRCGTRDTMARAAED